MYQLCVRLHNRNVLHIIILNPGAVMTLVELAKGQGG